MTLPITYLDSLGVNVLPELREYSYASEIEKSVEIIGELKFKMGRESGISLGRTISEYAHTKGISFEEARKELGI